MAEINQKELQEFWEWCGFTQNKQNYGRGSEYLWNYPDAQVGTLPSIDLNNLFKYAVPKVYDLKLVKLNRFEQEWQLAYRATARFARKQWGESASHKDPAMALYQAIQKVRQAK